MSKTPETFGEDEAPTPLATLGDVRRALAKALRRIEKGYLDHKTGQVLINGYGCLAGVMQDDRDSRWQQRARILWDERGKAANAQPIPNH